MSANTFPPLPPKRDDDIDLSHITVRPYGSRYADIAVLKTRPKAERQLRKLNEKLEALRQAATQQHGT